MSEAIKFPIMTEPIILVNRDGTAGQKVYQVMLGGACLMLLPTFSGCSYSSSYSYEEAQKKVGQDWVSYFIVRLNITFTFTTVYTKFSLSAASGSSSGCVDAGSNITYLFSFKLTTAGATTQKIYINKNGVYSGCYFLVSYTVDSSLESVSGLSITFNDEIKAPGVTASANYTAPAPEQGIEESKYDISLTIFNPNSGICSVWVLWPDGVLQLITGGLSAYSTIRTSYSWYESEGGAGYTSAVVILEYPSLAPGHFKRTNISWSY